MIDIFRLCHIADRSAIFNDGELTVGNAVTCSRTGEINVLMPAY